MSAGTDKIRCTLCRKDKKYLPPYVGGSEIHPADRVCNECKRLWELGRKREKAAKADEALTFARVTLEVALNPAKGLPQGDMTLRSTDLIAAMGATKLRGTDMGGRWEKPENAIGIGFKNDKDTYYIPDGNELVQVPKARATAMAKIISCFYNALAKARVDGFNEGSSLLKRLAEGGVSLDSFSVQCDNARAGRKPRGRYDD